MITWWRRLLGRVLGVDCVDCQAGRHLDCEDFFPPGCMCRTLEAHSRLPWSS